MSEEKVFKLEVTEQELNIVSAGLVKLPFEIVSVLIGKFQHQINSQTAPPAEE